MDANSSAISRFKAQANKFSGILSKGLRKTTGRLIKELIYGIQACKDIKISNIARSLQEDIKLIKTEDRLCRNLAAEDFSNHINEQIIRLGDDKITDEMVIAIDLSDPNFDVEMICRKIAMSHTALYKKVKSITGLTINEIVKNVRLKRAAALLAENNYTVYEVADMVGYNDSKYFSREFKKKFGISPKDSKKRPD